MTTNAAAFLSRSRGKLFLFDDYLTGCPRTWVAARYAALLNLFLAMHYSAQSLFDGYLIATPHGRTLQLLDNPNELVVILATIVKRPKERHHDC
jgi:hypothetical protein